MRLKTIRVPEWPVLGWLAVCPAGSDEVTGYIGTASRRATSGSARRCGTGRTPTAASTRPTSCSAAGCGSGATGWCSSRRAARSTGCTPMRTDDALYVSNSLACLLSFVGGSLDLANPGYREIFDSVTEGHRALPAVHPDHGRAGAGDVLRQPGVGRRRGARGREAVRRRVTSGPTRSTAPSSTRRRGALTANARAVERRHPLGLTSTLSSGYDSSAVTVLAHQAGCTEAIGFDRGKRGADDSGAQARRGARPALPLDRQLAGAEGRRAVPRRGLRRRRRRVPQGGRGAHDRAARVLRALGRPHLGPRGPAPAHRLPAGGHLRDRRRRVPARRRVRPVRRCRSSAGASSARSCRSATTPS